MRTEPDAWLAEHQGELLRIEGYVWYCGDDWCDCSEPVIAEVYANRLVPRAIIPIAIWQGTFRTDGEPGGEAELAAKREEMMATTPDQAARIEWHING